MMTDKRRAAIRRALNAHLERLEQANRLARLRDAGGRPIEAYTVAQRRIRHRHDMFLETLRRWFHKQPGVWGFKPRKSDGAIVYGPHYE